MYSVLFPLLFPTGAPPTARWRRSGCVAMTAGFAFTPGEFEDLPSREPGGAAQDPSAAPRSRQRPRLPAPDRRDACHGDRLDRSCACVPFAGYQAPQQLKWVTVGAALLPAVAVPWAILGYAGLLLGALIIAGAFAVAMLRHRLYDVDAWSIARCLRCADGDARRGRASAACCCSGCVRPITEESSLAIAGSTLAVAALFRPARARSRERSMGASTGASTTPRARSSASDATARPGRARQLERRAARRRTETLQPAHVSLWLRAPQ